MTTAFNSVPRYGKSTSIADSEISSFRNGTGSDVFLTLNTKILKKALKTSDVSDFILLRAYLSITDKVKLADLPLLYVCMLLLFWQVIFQAIYHQIHSHIRYTSLALQYSIHLHSTTVFCYSRSSTPKHDVN